jgi:hypothetical protein
MAKSPSERDPGAGQVSRGVAGDYLVGYGRPPTATRFRPGQSGNPKGRPKGRLNLGTEFNKELNRVITVREGGRSRRLKKGAAWLVKTINGALSGDARANVTLAGLLRTFGLVQQPQESEEPALDLKKLSDEDLAELERILTKGTSSD